eukprot:gene152-9769_t
MDTKIRKILTCNRMHHPKADVVRHSFNVINWNLTEIKKMDTKIRKILTCNRMHHPKADVVRHSFNVINWNLTEIKKMDTKIRKILTCNRMHHPKADVVRHSFNVINWNLTEIKKMDTKIRKILTCNRMHHPKADVVRHSFNVINWNLTEIKKMDTKIRKILTCNRMHHPKADVDRLYLPRRQGGRGMIQLELSYKTSTIGLVKYLETTKDWMLALIKDNENQKKLHSIVKESRNFEREIKVENNERQGELEEAIKEAKKLKVKVKAVGQKMLQEKWEQKSLHGKYVLRSKDADWLRSAGLKAATEGFLLAAQDQTLSTRNYQANILKNGADPKCRYCNEQCETIDHLVSGRALLAPNEYKARHDRVGQYLHWKICHHFGVETPKHWYEHHPDHDNVQQLLRVTMFRFFGTSLFTLTEPSMLTGQTS